MILILIGYFINIFYSINLLPDFILNIYTYLIITEFSIDIFILYILLSALIKKIINKIKGKKEYKYRKVSK
jgi:hypothetical protein